LSIGNNKPSFKLNDIINTQGLHVARCILMYDSEAWLMKGMGHNEELSKQ